ncbi:MAG: hypothetical protein VX278_19585 [Myxococcota bacterium]|nr:hypothetical protein [Myxococcota bacterium]
MNPNIWTWEPAMSDVWAILGISVGVFVALGVSELLKKLGASVEWSRKAAHIGSGLLAIPFPYLFRSIWPVIILCVSFLLIMMVSKSLKMFEGVHGVKRESVGAYVFPLVIILIFALAQKPLHFAIPIAVLSLSDALAALIGKEYGSTHFHTYGERRSLEGSTAFLISTFMLVHLPLLLLSSTSRLECVLIALGTSILVTTFEMISIKGLDNVFIPFGTWYVLDNYVTYSEDALISRIVFLSLSALITIFFIKRRFFTQTGGIGVFLAMYGTFSLGREWFFLPALSILTPLILYALWVFPKYERRKPMGISRLFQTIIIAMLVLLIFDNTSHPWLVGGFLAAIISGGGFVYTKVGEKMPSLSLFYLISLLPLVVTYVCMRAEIEYLIPMLALSWITAIASVHLAILFDDRKAVFQCVKCSEFTLERRHCGEKTQIFSGSPYLTEFRLGLLSSFGAAFVGSGAYFLS